MNRTQTIQIRLTPDELRRLKSLARRGGVSSYLRKSGLKNDYRKDLSVIAALARVRNLLVQIAQNSSRRPVMDQVLIVSQLVTVERTLTKFTI